MPSAVAISGSPSRTSKSRRLAAHALGRAAARGFSPSLIDLSDLSADDLLGRTRSSGIEAALSSCAAAGILVVTTPVYRAAYSGLLKVFFDLFPQDALAGVVAVPIATGASPAHQLAVDHTLRPLLASVGALVVAAGVYAVDAQFDGSGPHALVTQQIDRAVAEAVAIVSRR